MKFEITEEIKKAIEEFEKNLKKLELIANENQKLRKNNLEAGQKIDDALAIIQKIYSYGKNDAQKSA